LKLFVFLVRVSANELAGSEDYAIDRNSVPPHFLKIRRVAHAASLRERFKVARAPQDVQR
jgi:hypothetical protein